MFQTRFLNLLNLNIRICLGFRYSDLGFARKYFPPNAFCVHAFHCLIIVLKGCYVRKEEVMLAWHAGTIVILFMS